MIEKNVFLYLHIPRTGGTTFQHSIGHPADKDNERYLKHYVFVDPWSEDAYEDWLLPRLNKRTLEQQKKLVVMSGHSIFCNSHRWLKEKRTPRIISTIRHPVERILSDFNYRWTKQNRCQDPALFSSVTPQMDPWATRQQRNVENYETLYEFYQDTTFQQNTQCKWIVKSFLTRDNDTWKRHPYYVFGPDSGVKEGQAVPETWPEWMYHPSEEIDWFEFASNFFEEIWWLGVTENLSKDIPDFCKMAGLDNTYSHTNKSKDVYWTMDDVRKQPDIKKLIEAEKADMKLYEKAKQWTRPF